MVGMDERVGGFALEDFVAFDWEDPAFVVDLVHQLLDYGEFVLGGQFGLFYHLIIAGWVSDIRKRFYRRMAH